MPLTLTELEAVVRAQAARIERLEKGAAAPAPKRLTRTQAAAILGCSVRMVCRYAARGLLVRLPKAARQRTTYFDPANVEALAVSEDHAREWVARRKIASVGKRRVS